MHSLIRQRVRPLDGGVRNTLTARASDYDLNTRPARTQALTPAAVLVALVERAQGLTVLLTRRTDHLHDHAGQISFPGGRAEATDEDAVSTALRETEEEIGINRRHIDVVGYLDLYETGSGFLVTPVVGFMRPGFSLTPDRFEVADVFEVPLGFVLDPHNLTESKCRWRGEMRRFYVYQYRDRTIWGATAGMLKNFAERLQD